MLRRAVLALALVGCKTPAPATSASLAEDAIETSGGQAPERLENASPWFQVADADLELHADYAWLDEATGRRDHDLEINAKIYDIIGNAKERIVASWFLFDCMIAVDAQGRPSPVVEDVAGKITDLLIAKRRAFPEMPIIILLDPLNRAYSDRIAPAVKRLTDAGIDVFYSDLVPTPPAVKQVGSGSAAASTAALREIHRLHREGKSYDELAERYLRPAADGLAGTEFGHLLGARTDLDELVRKLKNKEVISVGGKKLQIDGRAIDLEVAYDALLLKANHRKLLVADDGRGGLTALVASANPHNASLPSANYAISVRGATAAFIHDVLRADVAHAIEMWRGAIMAQKPKLAERHARFSPRSPFPPGDGFVVAALPKLAGRDAGGGSVKVRFVTESRIKDEILRLLASVAPADEVRIQMFYLSDPDVVDAIVAASKVTTTKLRLVLDPNLHAFNNVKDGTPNRQVAKHLLAQSPNIEIRWYETHGEQNHAKMMSITNAATGRFDVVNGSANWTGKNLGGPNMEADLVVVGSRRITEDFNRYFDGFYANDLPQRIYTVPYATAPHDQPVDDGTKWRQGEATGMVAW